ENFSEEKFTELMAVDRDQWSQEILLHEIVILLIPISITYVSHTQEIELFVMQEDTPVVKKKEEKKKIIKETKNVQQEITTPQTPEIQPVVITQKDDTPLTVAEKLVEVVNQPQSVNPPKAQKDIEDYEFGSTTGPRFINRVMPTYPLVARRLGKEGRVVLRLTIDDSGKLVNVDVIESAGYGFTESAIEAVRQSTFAPANKDGKPVISRALLPISFRLKKD
ncbi:MAG: energy transducer TonB, partial [Thermodesulfovibrionales bacterium]